MTEKVRKPRSDSKMYQLPKDVLDQVNNMLLNENIRRFLIKQGYTYKKKSLHAKEQERPRCAEKTQSMDRNYIWCKCRTSNITR